MPLSSSLSSKRVVGSHFADFAIIQTSAHVVEEFFPPTMAHRMVEPHSAQRPPDAEEARPVAAVLVSRGTTGCWCCRCQALACRGHPPRPNEGRIERPVLGPRCSPCGSQPSCLGISIATVAQGRSRRSTVYGEPQWTLAGGEDAALATPAGRSNRAAAQIARGTAANFSVNDV